MDAEEPSTPRWRPISSLLERPRSVASSSGTPHNDNLSRSLQLSLGSGSTDPGGEYHTIEHVIGGDMDIGRDIAPNEASICEILIGDLRSTSSQTNEKFPDQSYTSAITPSENVQIALLRAANTIRFNAKWFPPAGLAELLRIALDRASTTSSPELYAALGLIDTVVTYALLPAPCLPEVARFLAQSYYSASRAQKTRKLAAYAWSVAEHILKSHLGRQFIGALFQAMTGNQQSRAGFAATAGALMLLLERLRSADTELPPVNFTMLIFRLHTVAQANDDPYIMEHISSVLAEVFDGAGVIEQVQVDGGAEKVLEILIRCSETPSKPQLQMAAQLVPRLSKVEPHLLPKLALLYTRAGLSLSKPVLQELLHRYCPVPPNDQTWAANFQDLVRTMCTEPKYRDDLGILVKRSNLAFHLDSPTSPAALPGIVECYLHHITEEKTPTDLRETFARALVIMFIDCATSATGQSPAVFLFDALCTASEHTLEAADFLFRIRADVTGAIHIYPPDDISFPAPSGIATVSVDLPIHLWLNKVLHVLRHGAEPWEVHNVFLREIKYILSNHSLFHGRLHVIREIQGIIRGALDVGRHPEPPLHTGLSKSYVGAQLVRILCTSTSYHRQLGKDEIESLLSVFVATAGSRDHVVSIQCIHAITIACYELPETMSRFMNDVIDKMSRLITQKYLAIHVLQFFAGLSRLPDLYRNFTQTDYKKVFAVCYSYLQTTRGQSTTLERRQTPSSEQSSATRNEEALPEYVYALAHHVITFWYMSMGSQNRQILKPYIIGCLTYEVDGQEHIEDQGLVTLDMMDRVDAELEDDDSIHESATFSSHDGRLVERHRLVGTLLISTQTALRTGKTLVTVRRPSGTAQRLLETGTAKVTVESDDEYITVLPDDILGRTYGTVVVPKPSSALGSVEVLTLPEDDAVRRAIQSFDRTSALDSHKAGLIYIGEKQETEERILLNSSGSPDFRELVRDLGRLEVLKGAKFNTQGLDRADNMDGDHTVVWHNEVTELVFHITTLMPSSEDPHENTARKKRHIGNDHVNIVFNNSGRPLFFTDLYNIFPGQLTYVYIVISPSARTSFVEARTENFPTDKRDRFYKVQVVARPDYPNISSAAEMKVVSGASLPGMVRNLALNECIMSLMWTQRNDSAEYPSSWRSRLHQLRRLGNRYKAKWA